MLEIKEFVDLIERECNSRNNITEFHAIIITNVGTQDTKYELTFKDKEDRVLEPIDLNIAYDRYLAGLLIIDIFIQDCMINFTNEITSGKIGKLYINSTTSTKTMISEK